MKFFLKFYVFAQRDAFFVVYIGERALRNELKKLLEKEDTYL